MLLSRQSSVFLFFFSASSTTHTLYTMSNKKTISTAQLEINSPAHDVRWLEGERARSNWRVEKNTPPLFLIIINLLSSFSIHRSSTS